MFESDPELQRLNQRVQESIAHSEKLAQDYCDKYGCVEPDENTIKLEKFSELRARERK